MAPLTSPFSVLVSTISFISIWALMQHHVQAESRVASIASKLITYNNTAQTFLSIALLALILLSITTQPALSGPARLAYHYSKFYEYSDILLIAAQGKHDMISLHFGFHHFTTPWYTTMRVVRYSAGWEVFAGLNALHHTLMYGYFAGAAWTKKFLPGTQLLQLIGGILWDVWLMYWKIYAGEEIAGNAIGTTLLVCYLILHRRDVRMLEEKKEKEKGE